MVDEGSLIKITKPPILKTEVKTEAKPDSEDDSRKGLTARQYSAIFTAVMMITALMTQAAFLVSCAKQKAAEIITPVVNVDQVGTEASAPVTKDPEKNTSAVMVGKQQMTQDEKQNVSIVPTAGQISKDAQQNVSVVPMVRQQQNPNSNQNISAPMMGPGTSHNPNPVVPKPHSNMSGP